MQTINGIKDTVTHIATVLWSVQRCIKRLQNGSEENIYDYVYVMSVSR